MFKLLGRVTSQRPWIVIGVWVVFAVVVLAFAPKLSATTDQADFLPKHYESIRESDLQSEAFPEQRDPSAIVVFSRHDGRPLSDDDTARVDAVVAGLKLGSGFDGIGTRPLAPNRLVEIAVIGRADSSNGFDKATTDSVKELRHDLTTALAGTDLDHGVTGAAGQQYDSQQAGAQALKIVAIATVTLILVLLALIFRSVIICVMPLIVIGLAGAVATGLIGAANAAFDLKIDSSVEQILFVVLFGVGTDYILFFLFRYRERRRDGEGTRDSVAHALERAGEAIASAGGAVIVSFLALLLSTLGNFRSLGPALAIAVAVTLLAALTLVPAVVTVLGKRLFWPSEAWRREPKQARSGALGAALGRHPLRFALASGGLLVVLSLFTFGYSPTFDLASAPDTAESAVALKTLEQSLPAGAISPTTVLLHSTSGTPLATDAVTAFAAALGKADGVATVAPGSLSKDGQTAGFSVLLTSDPTSKSAIAAVKGSIRTTAHGSAPPGTTALVGGQTSVFADFGTAENRDYAVVFPVAAGIILLILALLLRSLVAPLYLLAAVGLGFGATLGASVIVFQGLAGQPGLIFLLPIYVYLFVVAIGTDYNILMIARLREEAREGRGARDAAAEAVRHAGPTIAAAGLILAGTFGSLVLGGQKLIQTIGFAVAFGILVSAFVMATFFVPAITALLGHAAWWPGHGDAEREHTEPDLVTDPR